MPPTGPTGDNSNNELPCPHPRGRTGNNMVNWGVCLGPTYNESKQEKRFFDFFFAASFIVIAVVMTIFWLTIVMGNFWYTKPGALEQLKNENPGIERIVRSERRIWRKSVFTVKENGQTRTFLLDTNILWNYKFKEKTD